MVSSVTALLIGISVFGPESGWLSSKTIGTIGLASSNRLVMGPAKQIVVGVDLLSDVSNFQLWYDINGDQLKHRVVTKLGVQVAYPEFWVSNNQA